MKLHKYVLVAAVALFLPTLSMGQTANHADVFGGLSYLRPDFTNSVSGGVPGWNISASVKLVRYLRVVADFSGFSPTGSNACGCGAPSASYKTYMGGPESRYRLGGSSHSPAFC